MHSDELSETVTEVMRIDLVRHRYPFCIVWTPIPILTWLCPILGHLGIATSRGVIRDFAGSFYVSEDNMAFGWPTRYWQLDPNAVEGGPEIWDHAVLIASDEYKGHVHNLCWDNCHSHVAMALNIMNYGHRRDYNTFRLIIAMTLKSKYVGFGSFLKQWLPFIIFSIVIAMIVIVTR